ncbi:hypothetical protein GCM10010421_07810 [Streptomyces glaucus]|uniref:Uncharacterized protein n=1 Tax=Streptomyces glaucus TaxID=284029 RepID=A0ABP5WDF3_9ACTN
MRRAGPAGAPVRAARQEPPETSRPPGPTAFARLRAGAPLAHGVREPVRKAARLRTG